MQHSKKRNNDPWVPLPEETINHVDIDLGPAPPNPLHQMIDSERYIQSLERKLEKLTKGRRKEPSSKDIISSLALFHDDQMRHFMDMDVARANSETDGSVESIPQPSYMQRKLHPERQPLSAEEITELVSDDITGKTFEEEYEEWRKETEGKFSDCAQAALENTTDTDREADSDMSRSRSTSQ